MTIKTTNDREAEFLKDLCDVLRKHNVELNVEGDGLPYGYGQESFTLNAWAGTEWDSDGELTKHRIHLTLGTSIDGTDSEDKPDGN